MSGLFTPGPLIVSDGAPDRSPGDTAPRWEVHMPGGATTAYCSLRTDALLYAAAPELYEALAFAVDKLTADQFHGDVPDEFYGRARAALAKASPSTPSTKA